MTMFEQVRNDSVLQGIKNELVTDGQQPRHIKKRILAYIEASGIHASVVARELGLQAGTISGWKKQDLGDKKERLEIETDEPLKFKVNGVDVEVEPNQVKRFMQAINS